MHLIVINIRKFKHDLDIGEIAKPACWVVFDCVNFHRDQVFDFWNEHFSAATK